MPFKKSVTDFERRVKVCSGCQQEKPFEDFYFNKSRGGGGIYARCKVCCSADTKIRRDARTEEEKVVAAQAHRDWRKRNKQALLNYGRKRDWMRRFGLSPEGYSRLLESQDDCCAICQLPVDKGKVLAVDHDHATGAVRGLLCNSCNVGLANFRDDTARLERAVSYLREPPAGGKEVAA